MHKINHNAGAVSPRFYAHGRIGKKPQEAACARRSGQGKPSLPIYVHGRIGKKPQEAACALHRR